MKLRTWCIRSGQILAKPVLVFAGFLVFLTIFNPAIIQAENGRGGITIRDENVSIQKVFQSIEKQSGYRFFYNETLLQGAVKVTLNLQNVSLQVALDACFRNQPLSYAIVDKTIIVKRKQQQSSAPIPTAVSFSNPGKGKLIAVSGKVTSNNLPVAGASIMIKGSDNGASTDKDGVFTLAEVDEDATLIISSVSHETREIKVNGQGFITIDLDQKASDLDEAVVVAYNTTTKRMNTGAVTVVKGEDIQNLPNRSVDKSLQGLVPGLLVTSGTGQPGGGLSNFVLRGISTAGNVVNPPSVIRNPLIVVDGIPVTQDAYPSQSNFSQSETAVVNPMAQLNPSDIDNISVLKDASAVALYGAKASNGVILITTKKGKAGKTRISFRSQADVAKRLKGKVEMLNRDEYLDLLFETYANSGYTNQDSIRSKLYKQFPVQVNGTDTSFYPFTNWEDELFAKTASTLSNELSVSGGTDKTNFYLNLEYTKQDGIVKTTGYDRKSIRFNFENRPVNWLKLGVNTALSYNIQDFSSLIGGDYYAIAYLNTPLNPNRLSDGNYYLNFSDPFLAANPAAVLQYNKNRNTSFRGLTKLYGEVSFLKHFKFSAALGTDFMFLDAYQKYDPRLYDPTTGATPGGATAGRIQQQNTRNSNLITTNILNYTSTLGVKHSINVLAGQEAQILYTKNLSVTGTGFRNVDETQVINTATKSPSDLVLKQTLLSYFGQTNYGYDNKYFLTASIRTDGSSLFGTQNRFRTFWSTGAGWVATEEKFLKSSQSWLSYLKLRGSIGAAGNSFVIDQATRFQLLSNYTYLNTIGLASTFGTAGNPGIKPERTFNWDAGLEVHFWNNRIGVTADVYKKKTKDVIYSIDLPLATGFQNERNNLGDMENKGVELSLFADIIKCRNFQWSINANWSTNKNVLTKANVQQFSSSGVLLNKVGKNFNSFYMLRWAGVNPDNGSAQWLDSAGNIISTYSSAAKDKVYVGKPQPDGFGAITHNITYKNFQISAIFYYQYGFQVYDNSGVNLTNDGSLALLNQDKRALDRWRKPGDEALNPKRFLNNTNPAKQSTRFLFNGDYIRLQTLTLGYTIPVQIAHRLNLNSVRAYVSGYNMAVWTKYPGGDISNTNAVGQNGFSYPNQKSWSFGLNINL
ncbi:hypothetical protein A4D02_10805 [Niastella koreensis]|uniref:TonB-dependent receptor plug n=2 Tax=Niastella koreensis TaxID=354356 RepID=G8T719_NIAKG|nr:TonB-dependent receptor [Niastella koreensis]AEV99040.1 TonB-dependent receptor plug [Niastella koreensis GR20-10]OQP43957.1 hypothetical protein A4D02_10805 [Niastella koreensis]